MRYGSLPGVTNHYGTPGLGVLGSDIRATTATGTHGPGYLYDDWRTGDDGKEFRGLVTVPPSAGTFTANEDGSFNLVGAPDGAYSFTYRLYLDGADLGVITEYITIGTVVAPVPSNTGLPAITGTPTTGQVLTASTGTWSGSPSSFAYRWLRGGTAIAGATASTYTLQAADVGQAITVGVTATNGTGASAEAVSASVTGAAPSGVSEMWTGLELEPGLTPAAMLRIILAALAGRSTGVGSTTEQYLSADGSKPRITVTFDSVSNRTTIVLDGS